MSFKKLMLGTAAGGGSGWILEYDGSLGSGANGGGRVLSGDGTDDGNMYCMFCGSTNSDGAIIIKFDKDGTVSADRRVSSSSYAITSGSMEIDTSENLYISLRQDIDTGSGSQTRIGLIKLNSSLSEQSEVFYSFGTISAGSFSSLATRGSNLYIVGSFDTATGRRPTGIVVSQSTLNVSSSHGFASFGQNRGRVVKHDSSGNIFVGGNYRGGSSGDRYLFYKFGTTFSSNSLGREYTGTSGYLNDLDIDSSGNIYTIGFCELGYPNTRDNLVAKLNSSGTAQWTKSLVLSGDNNTNGFISGDSTQTGIAIKNTSEGPVTVHQDNRNVDSSYNDINISLWNDSNGSLVESYGIACTSHQWQTSISSSNLGALITDTHVYHHARANNKNYILKLPIKDGSAVYGNYTLNGVNFTIDDNSASDTDANDNFGSTTTGPQTRSITKTTQTNWSDSAVSVTPNKLDL